MIDTIILVGRPAAGKSEIMDYLGKCSEAELSDELGMGRIEMLDDFPFLWEKFEEDDMLERRGRPRIWTTPDKHFTDEFFWTFMIDKLNLAYRKSLAKDPAGFARRTKVIEFARGGERGYREAFDALCAEILDRAAILYVKVPFEVSLARNRRRARPGMEDSILYHSLPDEKLRRYYLVDDWDALTGGKDTGTMDISGRNVRFSVFRNDPEQTDTPAKLGPALARAVAPLAR